MTEPRETGMADWERLLLNDDPKPFDYFTPSTPHCVLGVLLASNYDQTAKYKPTLRVRIKRFRFEAQYRARVAYRVLRTGDPW